MNVLTEEQLLKYLQAAKRKTTYKFLIKRLVKDKVHSKCIEKQMQTKPEHNPIVIFT